MTHCGLIGKITCLTTPKTGTCTVTTQRELKGMSYVALDSHRIVVIKYCPINDLSLDLVSTKNASGDRNF